MKLKSLFFLAALLLGGSLVFAQSDTSRMSYNVHLGNMDYSGDYAAEYFSFQHGIAGGVGIARYLNPSFDLMGEVNFGTVKGDNQGPRRNVGLSNRLEFKAGMESLHILGKYKFTNGYLLKESAMFSPYLLAGVGGLHSSSTGVGQSGAFTGESTIKVFAFYTCLGAGVKYQVNRNIGLYLQSLHMMPYTDKVDGWYKDVPANKKNDVFLQNVIGVVFTPGN